MERTPAEPAGTTTRTRVSWGNPVAGTNWTVSELTRCQFPAIDGDSDGIGESVASGSEKTTRIGSAPFTPCVCSAGVNDTTLTGVAAALWMCAVFDCAVASLPDECSPADAPLSANHTPPPSTAAIAAPSATTRQRSFCPNPDKPRPPSHRCPVALSYALRVAGGRVCCTALMYTS